MANKPCAVQRTEAFAQIVAFVEKFADVSTVAAHRPAINESTNIESPSETRRGRGLRIARRRHLRKPKNSAVLLVEGSGRSSEAKSVGGSKVELPGAQNAAPHASVGLPAGLSEKPPSKR